jgi:hypothetical protein
VSYLRFYVTRIFVIFTGRIKKSRRYDKMGIWHEGKKITYRILMGETSWSTSAWKAEKDMGG